MSYVVEANQKGKHAALGFIFATNITCHALFIIQQPMGVTTHTQQGTMHTRIEMNKQNSQLRSICFRNSGVSIVTNSRNEH